LEPMRGGGAKSFGPLDEQAGKQWDQGQPEGKMAGGALMMVRQRQLPSLAQAIGMAALRHSSELTFDRQ